MIVHVFTYTFVVRDLFIMAAMWYGGFAAGCWWTRREIRRNAEKR